MPLLNGDEQSHVVRPTPAPSSTNGSTEVPQTNRHGTGVPPSAAAAMDPIAVVGMALKFPQDATSPSAFWEMLTRGSSARTEVPGNRFNAKAFFKPDRNKTGTSATKHGHFIKEDIERFDAQFFSIAPHEAECMDPLQRWLLETSYQALENAGIPLQQINGTDTSVHVGCFMHEHELTIQKDQEMPITYSATGSASSMLANRLSWFYNLTGPSLQVDTACSSSLVALHLACQSIRAGETSMGIVCGSNVMFMPENFITLSNFNFLSPDGICHSFDEKANGYARGEGIAAVIIKPLSAALRDGDPIRAVIRGTGVNSDGHTPGITQPSSDAQARLIRETYERFGVSMSDTHFFEAHGTGTAIGDPKEAEAIASVFHNELERGSPLYVGAVKSNIGHLEGASGLAGLIKTVMVLERGLIPPNVWFNRLNPAINPEWGLRFPTEVVPWPTEGLRRASVNSFGFGGTNAHVIVDDAYHYLKDRELNTRVPRTNGLVNGYINGTDGVNGNGENGAKYANGVQHAAKVHHNGEAPHNLSNGEATATNGCTPPKLSPKLLVVSTADEQGVERLQESYSTYFSANSQVDTSSLAYTLSERRTRLPWKAYSVVDPSDDLSKLKFTPASRRKAAPAKLCFVFTGQGAQWVGMGRELLEYPTFRASLVDSDAILKELGCRTSVLDALYHGSESSILDSPEVCQPACTALQIALLDLLSEWEVRPSCVVGHSSGEIAASFSTGAISKSTALSIALFRGTAVSTAVKVAQKPSGMMAVCAERTRLESLLNDEPDFADLKVACYNSPENFTVSGGKESIEKLRAQLNDEGAFVKVLDVPIGYHHSGHLSSVAKMYTASFQNTDFASSQVRRESIEIASTVTGTFVDPIAEMTKPEYWVANLMSPVRFVDAVDEIVRKYRAGESGSEEPIIQFLEVGPHSTLRSAIKEILKRSDVDSCYTSILRRKQNAASTALSMAGKLFTWNQSISISAANDGLSSTKHKVVPDLPCYPFNHSKNNLMESRVSRGHRFREVPHNPYLGTRSSDWNPLEARWTNRIILKEKEWIEHHKVNGAVVYPAAGMLVMAIEAARELGADEEKPVSGYRFTKVVFQKALVIPRHAEGVEAQFFLRKNKSLSSGLADWYDFRLTVYENKEWAQCCQGTMAVEFTQKALQAETANDSKREQKENLMNTFRRECTSSVSVQENYAAGSRRGLEFGPMFRCLSNIHYSEGGLSRACVDTQAWRALDALVSDPGMHLLHPAALDAIFQVVFPAVMHQANGSLPALVPTEIRSMWISSDLLDAQKILSAEVFAKTRMPSLRSVATDYTAYGDDSQPCFFGDLTVTAIESEAAPRPEPEKGTVSLFNIVAKPDVDLLDKDDHPKFFTEPCTPDVELIADKEFACFLAISDALQMLGSEDTFMLPHHLQRYIEWAQWQVQMTNNAKDGTQRHTFNERLIKAKDPTYRDALERRLEASGPEGQLIVRISRNLSRFLNGEMDSLSYLFSDKLIEEFYRHATLANDSLKNVQKFVDSMAHKNPSLKILEVGAGTGGMTGYILETLRMKLAGETAHRFDEYCFTDISPSFFEPAVEKFGGEQLVCKTLDIERDPEKQGFEMGKYDVVVASNVLHATRSLTTTLTHVRKLLKPGGKLMLVEGTAPEMLRTAFIFGLLPGWWLGEEENRKLSPLVTPTEWDKVLRSTSFEGVDVWLPDGPDERTVLGGSMIATARSEPLCNGDIVSELVVIRSSNSKLQNTLLASFKSFGEEAGVRVTPSTLEEYTDKGAPCVFLSYLDGFSLEKADSHTLHAVENLLCATSTILWVTHNSRSTDPGHLEQQAIAGLLRSIQSERETLSYSLLSLEDIRNPSLAAKKIWKVVTKNILNRSPRGEEIKEEDGLLCLNRITEAKQLEKAVEGRDEEEVTANSARVDTTKPMELRIKSPGLLNSLKFEPDESYQAILGDTEIEIQTRSTSFQFRDLLMALGQVGGKSLGTECSGIVTRVGPKVTAFVPGDRVVAVPTMDDKGAFRTIVQCEEYLAQKMPDNLSFEEAASIPISYMTAHYSLFDRARLQKGESVLIHSGAGGLGQAAIQLAQLVGADIYVTVGSEEKAQLLQDLYHLPRDRILSSRTLDFADDIMRLTSGRGVDVVLNSLSGIGLQRSFECVARFGRFIEVGKRDIYSTGTDVALPMFPFSRNIIFASVDLFLIMYDLKRAVQLFSDVMQLVGEGKITAAQPLHVYQDDEFEKAFRFMQTGKSSGKIVVSFDVKEAPVQVHSVESALFDPHATYAISGGLGGIGKSIAKWMAKEGARNLLLLSRSGGESEKAKEFLSELEALGARVLAPKCDISDEGAVERALEESTRSLPPIKGCIQGSMVLKSALFSNMTPEQWNDTVAPKIQGSWNLHRLLPPNMDFFILLSSLCGIFGGVGQSNYSYGSAYQDELAKYRITQGLPAISIDLGVMESVGYVAEHDGIGKLMRSFGLQYIDEGYLHSLLARFCRPTSADPTQVLVGLMTPEEVAREGMMQTRALARPLFRHLHQIKNVDSQESGEKNQSGPDVREQLRSVTTMTEAQIVVSRAIQVRLSELLVIDLGDIDGGKPMHAFGVDSLVAIEMRNWFNKVIGSDVPVFKVLSNMSVDELALSAAETSSIVPDEAKKV